MYFKLNKTHKYTQYQTFSFFVSSCSGFSNECSGWLAGLFGLPNLIFPHLTNGYHFQHFILS